MGPLGLTTMELIQLIISIFLHLDAHLHWVIQAFGPWAYVLLFVIIFCETGLVITPILPGDSLLFAAGTFAATGSLNVILVYGLLVVAAILGDAINYWVGYYLGNWILKNENIRIINRKHLLKAHQFYEKHGGKTIILARFVPIVRTFAPFVAGMGKMRYRKFGVYNVLGGALWVGLCVISGYLFGNLHFVKENFTAVILAIIGTSLIPGIISFGKSIYETRFRKKTKLIIATPTPKPSSKVVELPR